MMASMRTGSLIRKMYTATSPRCTEPSAIATRGRSFTPGAIGANSVMDKRRWGPGEPLVFEPYTENVFEQAFNWITEREIVPIGQMGEGRYEQAIVSLA